MLNNSSAEQGSRLRDRRKEPRAPAQGVVQLTLVDTALNVPATLLDVSPSGFRALHRQLNLENGQIVQFCHATARGRARVMWNRITGSEVQSGFLIL